MRNSAATSPCAPSARLFARAPLKAPDSLRRPSCSFQSQLTVQMYERILLHNERLLVNYDPHINDFIEVDATAGQSQQMMFQNSPFRTSDLDLLKQRSTIEDEEKKRLLSQQKPAEPVQKKRTLSAGQRCMRSICTCLKNVCYVMPRDLQNYLVRKWREFKKYEAKEDEQETGAKTQLKGKTPDWQIVCERVLNELQSAEADYIKMKDSNKYVFKMASNFQNLMALYSKFGDIYTIAFIAFSNNVRWYPGATVLTQK